MKNVPIFNGIKITKFFTMNFIEFLKEQKSRQGIQSLISESFKKSEHERVNKLMLDIFNKKLTGITCVDPVMNHIVVNGKDYMSTMFIHMAGANMDCFTINYEVSGDSIEPCSISMYDQKQTHNLLFKSWEAKTSLSIYTKGTSVAYFIPIICYVINSGSYKLTKKVAEKVGKEIVQESSAFYLGAMRYNIVKEEKTELETARYNKTQELKQAKASGDQERFSRLNREYKEIVKAIQGGATTLEELDLIIRSNEDSRIVRQESIVKAESEFTKKGSKDPKQAFKEMFGYLNLVTKGLQPGVIICGAPGIGKTYKCLRYLESKHYENGKNMHIIKGKCTPRNLYLDLYNYKDKGEIIFIDDADALIGPKAPEEVINILKAALDSTASPEGRLVSYRVSGQILDDNDMPIPKEFCYNGSVIVLTNYGIGQLDTALRGRVFTQTLDFTTEQLLDIIKEIMPSIAPNILSPTAKQKAYDYLKELADGKTTMEISIRSFVTCAKIFEMGVQDYNDFDDATIKSMIKEQMTNQALSRRDSKHF